MIATPGWIAALSSDERRYLSNGALIGAAHKVEQMIMSYQTVVHHQRQQPASPTRDATVAALDGQIELLREERDQIQARRNEWNVYYLACFNAGVSWLTGEPGRPK